MKFSLIKFLYNVFLLLFKHIGKGWFNFLLSNTLLLLVHIKDLNWQILIVRRVLNLFIFFILLDLFIMSKLWNRFFVLLLCQNSFFDWYSLIWWSLNCLSESLMISCDWSFRWSNSHFGSGWTFLRWRLPNIYCNGIWCRLSCLRVFVILEDNNCSFHLTDSLVFRGRHNLCCGARSHGTWKLAILLGFVIFFGLIQCDSRNKSTTCAILGEIAFSTLTSCA